ncbi:MAG: autotransporter-associated beta strand repeat-containing protein [Verrucomicrobia bacterium]|nr:autotransporter-associated beta strand repeat-containing protein [Verrucomicrobiota bacterium]
MQTIPASARILSGLCGVILAAQSSLAGLVGYWNFNEGSGTVANDSTANHNHGTLTAIAGGSVPTWVAGHTGLPGDFALNTSGQGNVTVPDATSLHLTNTFTLAGWVYDNGSNYGHVFSAGADSTHRNWLLQLSSYGGDSDYFWSDQNNPAFKTTLSYVTPLNGWHHLAVTYNGSQLLTYGDGVLKSTKNISSALAAWGELHLGAAANNAGAYGSAINGAIDDPVIFNTVENVTSIMNGTHPAMLPLPVWTGGGTPNGSGQLVWSDAANWGGTAMAAGKTLAFATAAALGLTTNFNDFANNTQFAGITFNPGTAAFTLNGNTVNLAGDVVNNSTNTQTLSNSLILAGGTRSFNTAAGNVLVSNGIGQAASQTNGLTKSGSGTLTLAGTSSYTGATSVTTGKLLLNNATLGNTAVTVAGSSSMLAGTGTVTGAVTALSSAHLAPGINAATTGTLALTGGLTLNAANLDLKAAAPGTNDLVSVTGNLVLTGNTQVNLTQQLAGFGLGDYVILTYTGTLTGSASQLIPPPQDASYSYAIQTAGNQLKLHVAPASAKTYYVSQAGGNDSNSGLTSAAPWKTLAMASTVTLNAGDSLLLKCGDTWSEELQPKGSGTAGNPIYIGSYGPGNKPLLDRLDYTQDRSGIHLLNQAGYKIVGIEFARCMSGIYAEYAAGSPVRNFIWIEDCYFHDSLMYQHYEDYPAHKIGLGISLFSHETANNIVLSDVTIKNCVFRRLASGIWTNSPDNFNYYADNIWNFGNLNLLGCLFEEGYQWQLGLRGIAGGQVTNCVTHDIGRLNNFVSFNGVAGAMMYRLKDFTFTDSEWGFVSRGGGSIDGEAFDLEGNNSNMTFTNCLFHDTDGPCFMLYQGSAASPSNVGNRFTNCVWNGKAATCPYGQYPKVEIFNTPAGTNVAEFVSSRFYLSTNESRCNNNTGMTFTNCLTRNLSDAATGTNVALAATSSASSQQPGFEATKAKDGNPATLWRPSAASNEWLQLDFASPTAVNELRLREDPASSINRYTIQAWDSASSAWVGCFNGRTMGANFIAPIVSRTTTKMRLFITSTTGGTPGVAEFEAYYVEIPPPPSTAYWRVGDGLWDINTTANWKNAGGTTVKYVDGDIVLLDDTASGASPITITLNATVAPSSVTVNATKHYILTGSGGLTGAATLTKSNSGTLTLSSANTYTGTTTINGGTLSFGSAGSLPAGSVSLGDGTLEFTGSGTAGTYNLSASGGSSYLVNATHATGTLTVTRTHGNYNGMIKGGAGTVILANNFQDAGGLQVDAGTVILNGTSNNPVNWSTTNTISDVKTGATLKLGNTQVGLIFYDGGTFHMSGGTYNLNGQTPSADQNHSAPVIDGSGTITNSVAATTGTALFKVGTNKTFSGNIVDGAGAAKVAIALTSGGGVWTIAGANTYSGATTVNSGTLQAGSTTACSPNSAYSIASGTTLALAGFNNSLGSLTGAGNVTLGTAVLTIGNDHTSPAAFTGVISSPTGGSIIKTGTGTLTLNNPNSYGGTTTVSTGQLLVNGSLAGSGAVNVAAGASLGGTGLITGAVNVTGVLSPGGSIIESLSSGALTFSGTSTFACQLDSSVAPAVGADFQKVTGDLSMNSAVTLNLTNLAAGTFPADTRFSLVNYTGTWNGGFFQYGGSILVDGATFSFNSQKWVIDYDAASGGSNFSGEQTGGKFVTISLDPFTAWAKTNITAVNPAADATPGGDPDLDGASNLTEFAFHGNPLSGADPGRIFVLTADGAGNRELILTIAVRAGTAFSNPAGGPAVSLPANGISYTIEGSSDLSDWSSATVIPVVVINPGLPALGDPAHYQYASFILAGSNGLAGTGFLRAKVTPQ